MYESPVELIFGQIQTLVDGDTIKAVQKYGVNVDKDELVKALAYDRDQYNAGYRDAMATLVRCKDCKHLLVVNNHKLYAICQKTDTIFYPYQLDTRSHFCSFGERKGDSDGRNG